MTLRSGKEVKGPELVTSKDKNKNRIKKEFQKEGMRSVNLEVIHDSIIKVRSNPPPFPNRLEKPEKQDKEKEILEVSKGSNQYPFVGCDQANTKIH